MRPVISGLLFSVCLLLCPFSFSCEVSCQDVRTPCGASCNSCTTERNGNPFFNTRSQSWNAARELVGWQQFIHQYENEETYTVFSITPQYTESFRPCEITNYFFGKDLKNGYLKISGSRKGSTDQAGTGAVAREPHEWLADYFGLPTDFESKVNFNPYVKTWLADFNFFIGLNELHEGFFFKIHTPLVYTKRAMNMSETDIKKGTLAFEAGYMAEEEIPRTLLAESFTEAMKGFTWGDMHEPLRYGKINCCPQTKVRLSDIQLAFGWTFLHDYDYHLGVMLRTGLPTGGKPNGEYLFEPMIGNGGHYELGIGITGYKNLWQTDDEEKSFSVYCDINLAHLFSRKQIRSFDLREKPNSRYTLISELGTPVQDLYGGRFDTSGFPEASAQYQGRLFPLINRSTCCADVSIGLQGELALKFAYTSGNFSFDFGYNLWGRTGEKICAGCMFDQDRYALKGDSFLFGWASTPIVNGGTIARALSGTQHLADIHSGLNTPSETVFVGTAGADHHARNKGVDNAQLAWIVSSALASDVATLERGIRYYLNAPENVDYITHTSIQPIFLTSSDLNTGKTAGALSHKFFFHMNYAWNNDDTKDKDEATPFIGFGGEIEVSGTTSGCYNALSQWGVWIKGGALFH